MLSKFFSKYKRKFFKNLKIFENVRFEIHSKSSSY